MSSKFVKVFFGLVILLGGVVGFLVVGATESSTTGARKTSRILFRNAEEIIHHHRHRHHHHHPIKKTNSHDLNYAPIKRKVPNGPDPIHNRRAGNSHQPPGQA